MFNFLCVILSADYDSENIALCSVTAALPEISDLCKFFNL